MLHGVEIISKTRDARFEVPLQLTATEMRDAHHL